MTEKEATKERQEELRAAIDWIDDKLQTGRIRDPERAEARQEYLRLKIRAISEWRKLQEGGTED
jgi:hypothetical protein